MKKSYFYVVVDKDILHGISPVWSPYVRITDSLDHSGRVRGLQCHGGASRRSDCAVGPMMRLFLG